jgi:hypothetical protein
LLVDLRIKLNNAAPSVQFYYRTFLPTTGCSAPVPRIGTLILVVPPLEFLPYHLISRDFVTMKAYHPENFEELHETRNVVIPAKAGIQYYLVLSGFRIKSGMTGMGMIQRLHPANR